MKSSYKISLIVAAVLSVIVLVYYSNQDSPDQPSGAITALPEPPADSSAGSATNRSSDATPKAAATDKSSELPGQKTANDVRQRLAALNADNAVAATPAPASDSSPAVPPSGSSTNSVASPAQANAVSELRLDGNVPTPAPAPGSAAASASTPAPGTTTASSTATTTERPGPFDHLQPKTAPVPPPPPKPAPKPVAVTYTIAAGDTFSSIAANKLGDEKYWQQIAQANPTVDPQKLKVGQVIRLPGKDSLDSPAAASSASSSASNANKPAYVIKAGDTLSSIADQYYGDSGLWRTIYDANKSKIGSNPDRLKAGMELTIPPAPKGAQ